MLMGLMCRNVLLMGVVKLLFPVVSSYQFALLPDCAQVAFRLVAMPDRQWVVTVGRSGLSCSGTTTNG